MGSSPTPCPSGSIQCIPDVNVGSDARSSRHVLGNETLLPTEFCPIAEPMSLSFCESIISSSRVTFNSSSFKRARSAAKDASLAAKRSFILTLKYSYSNSYLCTNMFKINNYKNYRISFSYKFFCYLFQLRSVVQWKAIGRRRQNQNQNNNL